MAPFVKLSAVWDMLDDCLDGHERKSSEEYWTVMFNGRSYRKLPLGPHGRRQNVAVKSGHIRSLVRFFEIRDECVEKYLDLG